VDRGGLVKALSSGLPSKLASDLADEFMVIRRDVASDVLGRAAPGKFVETVVQAMEALENNGQYRAQPEVDKYLRGVESRQSSLPDGLRVCAARLARAMYALRSKRNIVHKATVDPSGYDLRLLYAGAQWILAELISLSQGISGDEAGRLVAEVELPAGDLVEVIGDRRIVHADLGVREEVLVLLMSHHPEPISVVAIIKSLDRRSESGVRKAITALWKEKLVERPGSGEVVLTGPGLREAIRVANENVA